MPTYYVWTGGGGWVDTATAGIPAGGFVASLDGITGAVSLVAGSNVTITNNSPSAGDITIASSGGGGTSGLVVLYDNTLSSAAASLDTGANGIAAGHGDLIVNILTRTADAATLVVLDVTLNGDSGAHYDFEQLVGSGSTATAQGSTAGNSFRFSTHGSGGSASYAGFGAMFIPSYDQTTFFKAASIQGSVVDSTASNGRALLAQAAWRSTAAINQITVVSDAGGNLLAGSRLVVYGTQ